MNVKDLLKRYPRDKSYLLEILNDIYALGYTPTHGDIKHIAKYVKTTEGHINGIITFYSMFPKTRRTPYVISICRSIVCHLNRSDDLIRILKDTLKPDENNISEDGLFTIREVECLGLCDISPAIMVNDRIYERVNEEKLKQILLELKNEHSSGTETE